jgi:hypothetical protein
MDETKNSENVDPAATDLDQGAWVNIDLSALVDPDSV